MQTDRTTKTILFLIMVALWVMILKPLFTPTPSNAQLQVQTTTPVTIVGQQDWLYVRTQPMQPKQPPHLMPQAQNKRP